MINGKDVLAYRCISACDCSVDSRSRGTTGSGFALGIVTTPRRKRQENMTPGKGKMRAVNLELVVRENFLDGSPKQGIRYISEFSKLKISDKGEYLR